MCFYSSPWSLGMGHKRDQDSSLTTCPKVLWTLSHLLNPPHCGPRFHFTHQQKPQPEGKKFSSHWSEIQEFIFLKVWSQAKLCYMGMLPKYRSVLFWIMKPLVVTFCPDIWNEKYQYIMCVLQKRVAKYVMTSTQHSWLIWILTFNKKGRWDAQGQLYFWLSGIHTLV